MKSLGALLLVSSVLLVWLEVEVASADTEVSIADNSADEGTDASPGAIDPRNPQDNPGVSGLLRILGHAHHHRPGNPHHGGRPVHAPLPTTPTPTEPDKPSPSSLINGEHDTPNGGKQPIDTQTRDPKTDKPGRPMHAYLGRPSNPHFRGVARAPARVTPPLNETWSLERHSRTLQNPHGEAPGLPKELVDEHPDGSFKPVLDVKATPNCYFRQDGSSVHWTSPRFVSKQVKARFNCSLNTYLTVPSIAVYALDVFEMTNKIRDKCRTTVYVRKPYERFNKLCGNLTDGKLYIPTSTTSATFWSKFKDNFKGFSLTLHFVTNAFTRLITLPKTSGKPREGILTNPNYPHYTPSHMAEYWIRSNIEGREIKLEMDLDIKNISNCRRDYLVVNPKGDSSYPRSTSMLLCGKMKTEVISEGGAMYLTYRSRHESSYMIKYSLIKP